jgi:hypothetical protein
MKTKATAFISLLALVVATSALAITTKPQQNAAKVDTQVESLASEIVAMAPRAALLDRPL